MFAATGNPEGDLRRWIPCVSRRRESLDGCLAGGAFFQVASTRRPSYFTATGDSFQMSLAYSQMVRSLENLPTRAVFIIAIRAHFLGSRKA
jgi:hypothetical protein